MRLTKRMWGLMVTSFVRQNGAGAEVTSTPNSYIPLGSEGGWGNGAEEREGGEGWRGAYRGAELDKTGEDEEEEGEGDIRDAVSTLATPLV